MDPTNNETEGMIRKVVLLHHKNQYRIASQQGTEAAFSNLMTCHLTWTKRGLNTREMLLEALLYST